MMNLNRGRLAFTRDQSNKPIARASIVKATQRVTNINPHVVVHLNMYGFTTTNKVGEYIRKEPVETARAVEFYKSVLGDHFVFTTSPDLA